MVLKTKRRKENERVWNAIYEDYLRLMRSGAMKMPAYERLGNKYGKHRNTICRIVRKMKMGGEV